jgi:DNA-binding response OmpR family regulator
VEKKKNMASSTNLGVILLVDDTPTNLEVLVESFSAYGFELTVAIDGETALAQSTLIQPDLILLDIMMPGMDGFETCRRFKEMEHTKDTPVIFMTALTDSVSTVKGFGYGAVDYVTKPLQLEEVLARVATHLKIRSLQVQKTPYRIFNLKWQNANGRKMPCVPPWSKQKLRMSACERI